MNHPTLYRRKSISNPSVAFLLESGRTTSYSWQNSWWFFRPIAPNFINLFPFDCKRSAVANHSVDFFPVVVGSSLQRFSCIKEVAIQNDFNNFPLWKGVQHSTSANLGIACPKIAFQKSIQLCIKFSTTLADLTVTLADGLEQPEINKRGANKKTKFLILFLIMHSFII